MPHVNPPEQLLLAEIQVLLAEKRTYYAVFRTGLGIMTVPLTVIIFLIATSQYHGIFRHFWLGSFIVAGLILVSLGGIYILFQSHLKIKRIGQLIANIERENKHIDEIIV